jgi:hypothetical protein
MSTEGSRKFEPAAFGLAIVAALLLIGRFAFPAAEASPKEKDPELSNKATLQNPPALGNGINLGGFSGLTHVPGDPENVFYTLTDRGPNETVSGQARFLIPKFTPTIIQIQVVNNTINILQQIPLKLPKGTDPITGTQFISGVSNIPTLDEAPFDAQGNPLPNDPYGLDTEGIAFNSRTNTFWLSEEYRPSLVEVSQDGTILRRLIPQGQASLFANATNVPIFDTLPADLGLRNQNRGLESVAIPPNGKYLYTAIQSTLFNPDSSVSSTSRVLRIVKMDLTDLQPIAEFAFLTPVVPGVSQNNIYISDMFAFNGNQNSERLLVDLRDNQVKFKNIVEIDLNGATNILGQTYQGKTPEQMTPAQLQQAGVVSPTQTVVLDLLQFGYPFAKVEGLFVVGNQLSVVDDNDFQIGSTDVTQLWTFKLFGGALNSN